MKRPESVTTGKKKNEACPDEAFRKQFPTIAMYMSDCFWDDGKPRDPSTLTINFSQGCTTISLADKALEQSAYTTEKTLQDALGTLEAALAKDQVTWRRWKGKR